MANHTYPTIDWHGLYGEGWGEDIVPEAFSHPAKFSRALIRHIYQYLIDNKLVERGARVLDPFGGVALGALDAQLQGLHWVGCELEPKFVALGNANLALWDTRYRPHFPRFGTARLVQGDSRRLREVIAGTLGGLVSSPPFQETLASSDSMATFETRPDGTPFGAGRSVLDDYGTSPGQLGAMPSGDVEAILSSPPYADQPTENGGPLTGWSGKRRIGASQNENEGYGESAGQLGAMPSGDYGAVIDALVSSPPFGSHDSAGPESLHTRTDESAKSMLNVQGWNGGGQVSESNLASMPEDDFSAVIASPPFSDSQGVAGNDRWAYLNEQKKLGKMKGGISEGNYTVQSDYGESEGQLGKLPADDFSTVIASPPFLQTSGGTNVTSTEGPLSDARLIERHSAGNQAQEAYGESEGQLQNMKEGNVDAILSSPPFHSSVGGGGDQLQYTKGLLPGENRRGKVGTGGSHDYGKAEGQLQNMREGDVDAIIASPPFTGVIPQQDRNFTMPHDSTGNVNTDYGDSIGQLASLPEGDVEAVVEGMVSSPPYAQIEQSGSTKGLIEHGTGLTKGASAFDEYGRTDGQLGREEGDSFWSASLAIVSQCYALLAPGGVAVWVCKDYVRNKRRVPFSDQWRMLCEKVGFVTLTEARAWVVEDNGTQLGMMETEDKAHRKERKSFFRRLAERKGSPRIDWETVWIMRKAG